MGKVTRLLEWTTRSQASALLRTLSRACAQPEDDTPDGKREEQYDEDTYRQLASAALLRRSARRQRDTEER